ncbi:MAG: T9SS type A sorting domain-containing protein [Ginsengibacter sp.]
MTKLLLLLSLVCTSFKLTAQLAVLNCAGGRYTNDVFASVTKTPDVIFGYNTTRDNSNATNYNQTLRFDFYEPAGDLALQRPLIILAFGGGFISGQRSDLELICIALAKKGYATASIDYRLIHPSVGNYFVVGGSTALLIDEVIKASADMKAAIRYFKRDAATTKTFKIDTTKIIIGGASAGSIAALQTAYADAIDETSSTTTAYNNNGGFEGNTDLPSPNNLLPFYNSRGIAGVLNIAGGVLDTTLVDADNPPVYASQGEADEVVPYNYGQLSFNGTPVPLSLFGSNLIKTRANNIGLKNELYPIPGGNHESPGTEPYVSNIVTDASAFIQSIVCASILPVTLTSFNVHSNNCDAVVSWQTSAEMQSSHYDIEASEDGILFTKAGLVYSKNSANGAAYTYRLNDYTHPAWFRIKTTDKDGSFTYSSIQKFNPACVGSLQVFPNPAHTWAVVNGLQTGMQVHIINAEGKLLWSQKAAGNTLQIPLSTFANGLLLVQVKYDNGKVAKNIKLIKK